MDILKDHSEKAKKELWKELKAMEITHRLCGQGYMFWGGRKGYETLLNTDMKRELDHLARFLQMAVDYKKKTGFCGQLLIEPKPHERLHLIKLDGEAGDWDD
jgi:xylose isomerase